MPATDEIREAVKRLTIMPTPEYWEGDKGIEDAIKTAHFADAVLNPPPDVAEAMRRSRDGFAHCTCPDNWPDCNHARKVTDWIVSLTAPNTEAK